MIQRNYETKFPQVWAKQFQVHKSFKSVALGSGKQKMISFSRMSRLQDLFSCCMSHQHVLKRHGSFSVRDPQMELITLIVMLFGAMAKLKMSLEIKAGNKNSIFSSLFYLLKRGHFLVLSKYNNAVSYRYGWMNELGHLDINRLMHELLGT